MNNIGIDPELASEMINLLAQELKDVRAQLRKAEMRTSTTPCTGDPSNGMTREVEQALAAENDSLKADNATLQEWIARLHDELRQVSSIKSEEDTNTEMPMSHTSGELAKSLAENDALVREKEEASQNQEKLLTLQEKYRRTKARVHEYNEVLNGLHVALSNCTQELEQSRKAVVSEIDFRDFLNDSSYEPVEGQLQLSSIPPLPCCRTKLLEQNVMDICNGPYFINYNEVIWSPSGIGLGLVIRPAFQYNPKIHGGAWTKFKDEFEIGKHMDVCCLSGRATRYLGTYERVGGTMAIAPEALKHLGHEKLNSVAKCTTLFPDLVPPVQTQMITNMYKQGVIKLQCLGIRRVAFNRTFAEKLQEMSTPSVQQNLPEHTVIPNVRKRKRAPKSVRSNKKRVSEK